MMTVTVNFGQGGSCSLDLPPKPWPWWLEKHGVELTGDCRIPKVGELFFHISGLDSSSPVTWQEGWVEISPRWILCKKSVKLIEEKDIPLCAIIRRKDLPSDVIEKACLALVKYANIPDHKAWSVNAPDKRRVLQQNRDLMNYLHWSASEEGSNFWCKVYEGKLLSDPYVDIKKWYEEGKLQLFKDGKWSDWGDLFKWAPRCGWPVELYRRKPDEVVEKLQPKPSQKLLDDFGMELTGEYRIPVKTDEGYVGYLGGTVWLPHHNEFITSLTHIYGKKRWILRKKVAKVPEKVEPFFFEVKNATFQGTNDTMSTLEKITTHLGGDLIVVSCAYSKEDSHWVAKVQVSKKNI